jgi:hypothetical protein
MSSKQKRYVRGNHPYAMASWQDMGKKNPQSRLHPPEEVKASLSLKTGVKLCCTHLLLLYMEQASFSTQSPVRRGQPEFCQLRAVLQTQEAGMPPPRLARARKGPFYYYSHPDAAGSA